MDHLRPPPESLLEHAEFLRALATSLLHDAHEAEDVAQETMIAAVRSAPPPGRLRAWLGTVARNLSISRHRSLRRRAHRERIAARKESDGTEVPDAVARLEAQQRVVAAVLSLDPDDRAIVLDRFFHDIPISAIARKLAIPPATARTRLRRALGRLRHKLEERDGRSGAVAVLVTLGSSRASAAPTAKALSHLGTAAAAVCAATVLWLVVDGLGPPDVDGHPRADTSGRGQEESLAVAPSPVETASASVTGRCVDAGGGALAGATVRLGETQATTGVDGCFTLPRLASTYADVLVAAKGGFASARIAVPSETGGIDLGEVPLHRPWAIRGVVTTPSGAPASRATIVLMEHQYSLELTRAVAGDDGRFSVPVPEAIADPGPSNETSLQVAAYLQGFRAATVGVPNADEELRIELMPAQKVRGHVEDARTGHAVPGAELFSQSDQRLAWRLGETGPDGAFAVAAFGDWGGGIDVRARGYAATRVESRLLTAEGIRILMDPAVTVRGRVVGIDGRPREEITVVATSGPHDGAMTAIRRPNTWAVTDANGAFEVEVRAGAPFRIEAANLSAMRGVAEGLLPPEQPVTLVLDVRESYHMALPVLVRDVAGRPLPGASVTWWAFPDQAGRGAGAWPQPARTDSLGYADVWTNRAWTNPVVFCAWAPGWFGASRAPVERSRLDAPAEVVCEPAGEVDGRVACALPSASRASLWWLIDGRTPWRVQQSRISKDGRFTLRGMPCGRNIVIVASPDGRSFLREIETHSGERIDIGELDLDAGMGVEGTVRTSAGEPVPNATVEWYPTHPYLGVFASSEAHQTRTDEVGAFRLTVWRWAPVRFVARTTAGRVASVDQQPGAGAVSLTVQ